MEGAMQSSSAAAQSASQYKPDTIMCSKLFKSMPGKYNLSQRDRVIKRKEMLNLHTSRMEISTFASTSNIESGREITTGKKLQEF